MKKLHQLDIYIYIYIYIYILLIKNYLVFTSYLELFSAAKKVYSWKSKGITEECIENPDTPNNSFAPKWAGD